MYSLSTVNDCCIDLMYNIYSENTQGSEKELVHISSTEPDLYPPQLVISH